MSSLLRLLCIAPALVAVAHAQGVIQSAVGSKGSVVGQPFQVDLTKSDANIINATEISDNAVNECGRTLLAGNIDIGTVTEAQLAAKQITSATKGSKVTVTINQINGDGAGPYTCDMDQTSNSNGVSGQTALQTTEKDDGKTTTLEVTMPANMACIGASTGNVCTVRCFNKAAAGPFGGCFAVQQTDVTPNKNTADNIATKQTLEGINSQIAQNIQDLPKAVAANQEAGEGSSVEEQGVLAINNLLGVDSKAEATAGAAGAASTAAAAAGGTGNTNAGNTGKKGKGGGNGAAGGQAAKGGANAAGGQAAKGAGGAAKGQAAKGGKNQRREAKVFVS